MEDKTEMNSSVREMNNQPVYERLPNKLHYRIFIRWRFLSLFLAMALYVIVILLFGKRLGVSGNYFIIIPVLSASLSFGIPGGLIGGSLGLPLNLLLFHIIGHPEFSPESKVIAEISGIVVGSAFGFLSNYFRQLNSEIHNRMEIEKNLRNVLEGKEVLFSEMHHRVKNNLNVIKSLVRLQYSRSENKDFKEHCEKLTNRIFSIAFVHDQLYARKGSENLDIRIYLSLLIENLLQGFSDTHVDFNRDLPDDSVFLNSEQLVPLSLIVNELITNSLKYAIPETKKPAVKLALKCSGKECTVKISDNGPGFDFVSAEKTGLGIGIITTLTKQLDGRYKFKNKNGSVFELTFPVET